MFEDAEIPDKKQISFTTDDLILLIGEKVVENKFQARILDFQKKKITELELKIQSQEKTISNLQVQVKSLKTELSKLQTTKHEYTELELKIQSQEKTISNLQVQIKSLKTELSKLQTTKHEYTISLEDKLHGIVLERDELRKEAETLRQKKGGINA